MAGLCFFNLSIGFGGQISKDGKQLLFRYGKIFDDFLVHKNER